MTTVINSDKTGTLTMNAMTATQMLGGGDWFKIEGPGYAKTGAILGVAGGALPDFRDLALGLVLCTDATVGDDESVIGDPTGRRSWCWPRRWAWTPGRPAKPLPAGPRCRSIPSTSSWPPSTTARTRWPASSSSNRTWSPSKALRSGPGPLRPGPVAWPAGADRHRQGRALGRQPQAVRARAAGPRVRRQGHG